MLHNWFVPHQIVSQSPGGNEVSKQDIASLTCFTTKYWSYCCALFQSHQSVATLLPSVFFKGRPPFEAEGEATGLWPPPIPGQLRSLAGALFTYKQLGKVSTFGGNLAL